MFKERNTDAVFSVLFLVLFITIVYFFQYRGALGESDLYRVLMGLLDGAVSQEGLASNLHYGRGFGFGYILAFYEFVPAAIMRDPDKVTAIINTVGLLSITCGLVFFWLSVALVYGVRAALMAMVVFAFSPMILELATSGHQILVAFAFLSAAAVFLFLPVTGWHAIVAALVGMLLLICGLTMRAEIFLALPYLVLARVKFSSPRVFVTSLLVRTAAPAAAFAIFFLLKAKVATFPSDGPSSSFFDQFYRWSNLGPGIVYLALGCGIVTVTVGALAGLVIVVRGIRSKNGETYRELAEKLVGPIALILVPTAFWIANPQPARHFILVLAGFAILIGCLGETVWRRNPVAALVALLVIVVGNQALSAAVRPTLLAMNEARSPYRPAPEAYRTFTHAPLGWSWLHHEALDARRRNWNALGDEIATACDAGVIIFSDEAEQLITRLYVGGVPVKAMSSRIDGFVAFTGIRDGRTFIFISKMTGWPADAIKAIVTDHSFDRFQLYNDPYTLSTYDILPIPTDRNAKFGCPIPG